MKYKVGQSVLYDGDYWHLGHKLPPIPAVVVGLTPKRVKIRFHDADYNMAEVVRAVMPEKLSPKVEQI